MVHTDKWKIQVKTGDRLEMSDARCQNLLKNYSDYFAISDTKQVIELTDYNFWKENIRVDEVKNQREKQKQKQINNIKEKIFRINEEAENKKQKQKEYIMKKNLLIRKLEKELKEQKELMEKYISNTDNEILNLKKQIGVLNLQINEI